jgi:membrane protein
MLKSPSTLSSPVAGPTGSTPLTTVEPGHPWRAMVRERGLPTLHYLARTEVHTFAFSVAANAILSFFPFVVLLMWLVHNVFHSPAMFDVITDLLKNQLPIQQDFIVRNMSALAQSRHTVRIASMVLLVISSSGVFLPLEVAFNRIWGFTKNRSYLGNQLMSFLLAVACGSLGLVSVGLAAGDNLLVAMLMSGNKQNALFRLIAFASMKLFSMLAAVGIFFLVYWLLPNGKIPAKNVLRAAVAIGIVWEVAKYIYILVLPWLNFHDVYGPFSISVTLMVWAYVSAMLVLAGAHLAALSASRPQPPLEPPLPSV